MISTTINRFQEAAKLHGDSTLKGDHKVANRCYAIMMESLEELKKYGPEASSELLKLLDDENDSVVSWAATHSLKFDEARAISALRKVAQKEGVIGFGAEIVIEQWDKGELKLP